MTAFTFGLTSLEETPLLLEEPHWHDEIELNLIQTGEITYMLMEKTIQLRAGELMVFWAGQPHRVLKAHPQTIIHWLTVPLRVCIGWPFEESVFTGLPIITPAPTFSLEQFRTWHRDLHMQHETRTRIVLLEVQALIRRCQLVHNHTPHKDDPPSMHPAAVTMAAYIAENFTNSLPVSNVTNQVTLTHDYAMTLFRKTFGLTILQRITQLRLTYASLLLRNPHLSIDRVAHQTGFGSISRFYEVFRDHYQMSPGQYRRTH